MLHAWRIELSLEGPLGTPLASGTLFGHIAWAKLESEGEAALENWLANLALEPFLLSDAFPANLLPRPLLAPSPWPTEGSTAARARAIDQHEAVRRHAFVTKAAFLAHRRSLTETDFLGHLHDDPLAATQRQAHVALDRLAGRPLEPGGLYFTDAWRPTDASRVRDLYVQTSMPETELRDLLGHVGRMGYGRDSSTGHGQFRVVGITPETELFAPIDAPIVRHLSLSHGCMTANMRDARWRLVPHFGKVGRAMQLQGLRPWKRPILLMAPGATWQPADDALAGAWLDGELHQDNRQIGHHAFHLAVPFLEAPAT